MKAPGPASTMKVADQLAVLSRTQIERRGRWRSFRRSLSAIIGLIVILTPLYLTCAAVLPTVADMPSSVPARIVLLLEVALIRCYFQFAWRCLELVNSARALPVFRSLVVIMVGLVALGAVIHLIENVIAWMRVGGAQSYPVSLIATEWLFWLHIVIATVGLLGCVALAVTSSAGLWWRRSGAMFERRWALNKVPQRWVDQARASSRQAWIQRWRATLDGGSDQVPEPERGGTVICCSGGGIRSASFCLGGLQELGQRGVYRDAKAVVGVSGGGYIAAALHVLRWRSKDNLGDDWAPLSPEAFAPTSEEARWLRRHTRYLFDSLKQATLAALAIVFGMTVNLFWCAVALGVLAWWLGWLLNASGGLVGWNSVVAVGGHYEGAWAWLGYFWAFPVVGVALFVLERFTMRLVTLPVTIREGLRTLAVAMLWVGVALWALVTGLPRLMAAIHNYAATSDSVWAGLIHAVGLVPDEVCGLSEVSCGTQHFVNLSAPQTTWGSLVAIAASILAVVRFGLAKSPGEGAAGGGGRLAKLFSILTHVLLPWAALIVIIVAALTVLMRWVATLVGQPGDLANWPLIYGFVIAIVILTVFTDANWTSLHHFYRERISYAFLQQRVGGTTQPLSYREPLRFSESAPKPGHGPELIACAVANVSDVEYVPADRRATPFVFDHRSIGLTDRAICRQMPAATYEFAADFRLRDATIPAAMAMSGAAFSPLVGREHRRVAPYRLIMALANARLGVWLPNPLWTDDAFQVRRMIRLRREDAKVAWHALPEDERIYLTRWMISSKDRQWLASALTTDEAWFYEVLGGQIPDGVESVTASRKHYNQDQLDRVPVRDLIFEAVRSVLNQPGWWRLFKEGIGKTSLTERRLYITDGGHYDNLGLVEALRRRPDEIFVLDASNDAENSFRALGEAMATARIDLDCELSIDPTPMITGADHLAGSAWQTGIARYADGTTAEVHFVKAIRTRDMSLDNKVYALLHPEFPRTSTGDQFYGELDFEAYRRLGVQATRALLDDIAKRPAPPVTASGPVARTTDQKAAV